MIKGNINERISEKKKRNLVEGPRGEMSESSSKIEGFQRTSGGLTSCRMSGNTFCMCNQNYIHITFYLLAT